MNTILVIDGQAHPELHVLAAPSLDPAQPQSQWLSIPGGVDIDVTGALTGGWADYARVKCVVPLAVTDLTVWAARQLYAPRWHGKSVQLSWAEYPGRHLRGRARLYAWSWPAKRDVVTFTLELDAEPYWWADELHTQKIEASAAPGTAAVLQPTGYPVMPRTKVVGGPVQILIDDTAIGLNPGEYAHVDAFKLHPYRDPFEISVIGYPGSEVTFTWQEGWLV